LNAVYISDDYRVYFYSSIVQNHSNLGIYAELKD